jgi:hypothetical protein
MAYFKELLLAGRGLSTVTHKSSRCLEKHSFPQFIFAEFCCPICTTGDGALMNIRQTRTHTHTRRGELTAQLVLLLKALKVEGMS